MLLFDQNLSFRLCRLLDDVFPDSVQVRRAVLLNASDWEIWNYAKHHNLTVVSQDSDFADLAGLYGPPPKVIWLRCGNQTSHVIEKLLRRHSTRIFEFLKDDDSSCIELL